MIQNESLKFTPFDSLKTRKLKLAYLSKIPEEFVKTLAQKVPHSYEYLGVYLLPFNLETLEQFPEISEDEKNFHIMIWKNNSLPRAYLDRKAALEKKLERYLELLEDFYKDVQELKKLDPLPVEEGMEYAHKAFMIPSLILDPKTPKVVVEVEDWLEIIDKAELSRDVPLIYGSIPEPVAKYTVKGFTFFYEDRESLGLIWDQLLDVSFITELYKITDLKNPYLTKIRKRIQKIIDSSSTNIKKPQIFIFVVADGIKVCIYELNEGKIHFEIPEDGTDIVAIIKKTFPNLSFKDPENSGFRYTFRIPNIKLNNIVFLDMIRTDSLFKDFLFLDETKKAFPDMEKPYFTFHGYDDPYEIKININPVKVKTEENTIEVIISVDRKEQADNFVEIFSRLMRHYKNIKDKKEVLKLYKEYLVELPENFKLQPARFRKPIKVLTETIKYLPKNRRPTITETKDPDKITAKFPPKGKTEFYYYCENSIYRFPSTKKINGAIIPYCRKLEELTPQEMENFDVELPRIEEENMGKRNVLGANIELQINRLAHIHLELGDLLSPILADVLPEGSLRKMGNTKGFDSLLGCVAIAADVPEFKIENPSSYLRRVRGEIARNINPIICAQENPGLSGSQITEMLADPDVELDSAKFYRAVEEFFKVNLFIWKLGSKGEIIFEIPNHKFFHARRFNPQYPSILIYRFEPPKRKSLEETQYQLIIKHDPKINNTIRIFGAFETQRLIQLYYSAYKVEIVTNGEVRTNSFKKDLISGGNITYQILDFSGKTRGLIVDGICILVPPTAPYDLPVTEPRNNQLSSLPKWDPTAISLIGESLIGIWIDVVYVPIEPIPLPSRLDHLPNKKPPWIKRSQNRDFEHQYRVVRILMTLIRWLYLTNRTEFSKRLFFNPNVRYEVINLGRRLPVFDHFSDALIYIENRFSGLVQGDKIVVPGEYMVNYIKESLNRADPKWREKPTFIPNFYIYKNDFLTKIDLIYIDLKTLDMALSGGTIPTAQNFIPSVVSSPIIFKERSQIFLFFPWNGENNIKKTYDLFVQLRGLSVPFTEIKDKYIVYDIDLERKLVPVEDHTQGSSYFLTLIPGAILIPLT